MLPAARAKNGRQHSVPLSPQALAILDSMPRGEGNFALFEPALFSREKAQLDAALGPKMGHWTLHDLRRTCASGMASRLPYVVEACLNHKSGVIRGVASVYNRYSYPTEKRDALEKWGAYVAALPVNPVVLSNAA